MKFSHFDDPERAKRIYTEYISDLTQKTSLAQESIEATVQNCTTCEDLDIKLDSLLCTRSIHICSSLPSPMDSDSGGYQSVAYRAYEDVRS